jgi:hypothetical protein
MVDPEELQAVFEAAKEWKRKLEANNLTRAKATCPVCKTKNSVKILKSGTHMKASCIMCSLTYKE